MKKLMLTLLLLLIHSSSGAVSVGSSSLEWAINQSEAIAHVRVTEGKALFFRRDEIGRVYPCGGVYKAEILNLLKGEVSQIEFGINFNLMLTPGSEYLLFFDNRGGLGIEASMFKPADYEECTKELPSLMARWRESSLIEWEPTDDLDWVQLVNRPFGVSFSGHAITDDAKFLLEEYVEIIESIISDQAENGFRRDVSGR